MPTDTAAAPAAQNAPHGTQSGGRGGSPSQAAQAPRVLKPLAPGTIVPVSGTSFHPAEVRATHIGDEVVLAHDQTNPYDVDAVSITTTGGAVLGNVPAAGKLNSRLLVGHRGGVWAGTIVDKVGFETIGLRVKIHSLVSHRPAAFGTGIAGVRGVVESPEACADLDPTAGDGQPDPTGPGGATGRPADAAATSAVPAVPLVLAAGSGRVLGELVESSGHRVRVRVGDRITSYPAGVVKIQAPEGPDGS